LCDKRFQESGIGKQGGINQAILLLSMKQNSKAWEVLKKVEDTSPDTEYVKAIAANRLNNVNEAVRKNALFFIPYFLSKSNKSSKSNTSPSFCAISFKDGF